MKIPFAFSGLLFVVAGLLFCAAALLLVPALLCLGAGLLFLLPDRRKSRRARGKYAQGRGRGKE